MKKIKIQFNAKALSSDKDIAIVLSSYCAAKAVLIAQEKGVINTDRHKTLKTVNHHFKNALKEFAKTGIDQVLYQKYIRITVWPEGGKPLKSRGDEDEPTRLFSVTEILELARKELASVLTVEA